MSTKSKATEAAVLDAAANVVDMTLVRPSDVKGSEANVARTLDREIRAGFTVVLESQGQLVRLVKEAKQSQIHKMLTDPETGKAYKSWTAYMANVIAGLELDVKGMAVRDRAFLIVMLYNTGMSQKVIADALSVSAGLVNKAIQRGRQTGDVDADRETTGKDGKTTKATDQTKEKVEESKVIADAKRLLTTVKRIASAEVEDADKEALAALLAEVQTELTKAKKCAKA